MQFPVIRQNKFGKVKIYQSGGRFELRYKMGDKMRRETRASLTEAQGRAERVLADMRDFAVARNETPDGKIREFLKIEEKLSVEGVSLDEVVSFYFKYRGVLDTKEVSLAECLDAFYLSRGETSQRNQETLRYHLQPLREAFRCPMLSVTQEALTIYLNRWQSPRSRLNVRTSLCALFQFAKDKGWLPYDRPTAADMLPRPKIVSGRKEIVTPAQLRVVLEYAEQNRPDMVPYIVLGAFAGIRTAERTKLTWDDIKWEDNGIVVEDDVAKISRRRSFEMEPNLREWLDKYRGFGPIVPVKQPTKVMAEILKDCEIDFANNALRRSFASYHMALYHNAPLTSFIDGHSIQVLERDYKMTASKADAGQWFDILPNGRGKQHESEEQRGGESDGTRYAAGGIA